MREPLSNGALGSRQYILHSNNIKKEVGLTKVFIFCLLVAKKKVCEKIIARGFLKVNVFILFNSMTMTTTQQPQIPSMTCL